MKINEVLNKSLKDFGLDFKKRLEAKQLQVGLFDWKSGLQQEIVPRTDADASLVGLVIEGDSVLSIYFNKDSIKNVDAALKAFDFAETGNKVRNKNSWGNYGKDVGSHYSNTNPGDLYRGTDRQIGKTMMYTINRQPQNAKKSQSTAGTNTESKKVIGVKLMNRESKNINEDKNSVTKATGGLVKVSDKSKAEKFDKPKAIKITPDGPSNSVTSAKPDKVVNQVKVMDVEDVNKQTIKPASYKCTELGVDLEIKSDSGVNLTNSFSSTYIIAQLRKMLEGSGPIVKKITIEMGIPDDPKTKNEEKLRKYVRNLIEQIIKEK